MSSPKQQEDHNPDTFSLRSLFPNLSTDVSFVAHEQDELELTRRVSNQNVVDEDLKDLENGEGGGRDHEMKLFRRWTSNLDQFDPTVNLHTIGFSNAAANVNLVDSYRTSVRMETRRRADMTDLLGLAPYSKHLKFMKTNVHEEDELLKIGSSHPVLEDTLEEVPQNYAPKRPERYGDKYSVFNKCVLHTFGGLFFFRLGLVYGRAGFIIGTFMILGLGMITVITSLSLSAIASNGEVSFGGIYYLVSRNLGPRIGASIGFMQSVILAMNVGLFSSVIAEAFQEEFSPSGDWFQPVLAVLLLIVSFSSALAGLKFNVKIEYVFMLFLSISIFFVVIGSFVPPMNLSRSHFDDNADDQFESPEFDFVDILGIFLPSLTGFTAGTIIVADLKNQERDFPLGTVGSAVLCPIVYIILGILIAGSASRNDLQNHILVMGDISLWAPITYVGIFVVSITSIVTMQAALSSILSGIGRDKLFPYAEYLNMRHASFNHQAWLPYVFGFVISIIVAISGPVNLVAPYVSCATLLTFAFINFACFLASSLSSPGWRPAFKFYNRWVALGGCLACIALMMAINAIATAAAFVMIALLYKLLSSAEVEVNWGTAGDEFKYTDAIRALSSLSMVRGNSKTYRPNLLVLCGDPSERVSLVKLTYYLHKSKGLLCYANIQVEGVQEQSNIDQLLKFAKWQKLRELRKSSLKEHAKYGIYEQIISFSFLEGCRSILQLSGLGPLRSNTVALGFKDFWYTKGSDNFVEILRTAFSMDFGVLIYRNWRILKFSEHFKGTIDVWWLSDDGGLAILIPFLYTRHSAWKSVKLRVLTISPDGRDAALVFGLLRKLRIAAEIIPVVPSISTTTKRFQPSNETIESYTSRFPSLASFEQRKTETEQYLHISELIQKHSKSATLVFISMPVPNVSINDDLYLSWLDILTSNIPPSVLLRGNQAPVLSVDL